MNEKIEESGVEVQGIEVIDLGDAGVETKQPSPLAWILDSCCAYTYLAE
jgi:hypothetical protein